VPTQYSNYHTYGVIKTENSITFTLDGKPYAQRKKTSLDPLEWPFDQPYYLILNLAVGGKWAGSDGIDVATAPWKMEIQSISYKPL
jgi:beta-glucanase (GH16 family)